MLKAQLTSESQPKIIQLFYIHTKKKNEKETNEIIILFQSLELQVFLLPFSIGKNSFRTG